MRTETRRSYVITNINTGSASANPITTTTTTMAPKFQVLFATPWYWNHSVEAEEPCTVTITVDDDYTWTGYMPYYEHLTDPDGNLLFKDTYDDESKVRKFLWNEDPLKSYSESGNDWFLYDYGGDWVQDNIVVITFTNNVKIKMNDPFYPPNTYVLLDGWDNRESYDMSDLYTWDDLKINDYDDPWYGYKEIGRLYKGIFGYLTPGIDMNDSSSAFMISHGDEFVSVYDESEEIYKNCYPTKTISMVPFIISLYAGG